MSWELVLVPHHYRADSWDSWPDGAQIDCRYAQALHRSWKGMNYLFLCCFPACPGFFFASKKKILKKIMRKLYTAAAKVSTVCVFFAFSRVLAFFCRKKIKILQALHRGWKGMYCLCIFLVHTCCCFLFGASQQKVFSRMVCELYTAADKISTRVCWFRTMIRGDLKPDTDLIDYYHHWPPTT